MTTQVKTKNYVAGNEKLLASWDYEKNTELGLYPDLITIGSHKKAYWKCSDCGCEWFAEIHNRAVNGTGCPECGKKKHATSFSSTAAVKNPLFKKHPELLKDWNADKNPGINPDNLSAGSEQMILWTCHECGHEWKARPHHRASGTGCPECAKKRLGAERSLKTAKRQSLAKSHPEIAAQWHPTKNCDLTPDKVSRGSEKKVWWKCSCGCEWETKVQNRTAGTGCPECGKKKQWETRRQNAK